MKKVVPVKPHIAEDHRALGTIAAEQELYRTINADARKKFLEIMSDHQALGKLVLDEELSKVMTPRQKQEFRKRMEEYLENVQGSEAREIRDYLARHGLV